MRKRQRRDDSTFSLEERTDFYENVKKPIIERSGGRCEFCGRADKKLYVHHILPYSRFPKLNRDLDNMLHVCISCHNNIHEDPFLNCQLQKELARKKHINLAKYYVICENY